ncbi:hypothetical protein [Veillonella sp.]|uniref:hypothetical protein n=1 Tax=Veillonella sp. TaxID=1926307 RepID=UPI0026004777|nr:hypothetical protein [Veillonella sp.]
MKKFIVPMIIGVTLFAAGCGQDNKPTEQPKPEAAQTQEKAPEVANKVTTLASIGATKDAFKEEYGAPTKGNDMQGAYQKENLFVTFVENRAINVVVQKDFDHLNDLIPADAKEVDKSTEDDKTIHKETAHYTSDKLSAVSKAYKGFTVIKNFDSKSGKLLNVTIDVTL